MLAACAELPTVDIRFDTTLEDLRTEESVITEAHLSDGTRLTAKAFVDAVDIGSFERVPVAAFTTAPYHRGDAVSLGGSAFGCHPMTDQG
ncbi:hypothetical protein [Nocardia tenerifensis]|uniref:hypothetical protein n=1 Tax=Nocardia tenerifensis TaxID=228006 RepID=UPI0003158265|nr:hypothetical protein [Nocardia tenerifensis]